MGRRFKLAACESMKEGLNALLPECKNTVDMTFVDKGLHSAGQVTMPVELQKGDRRN